MGNLKRTPLSRGTKSLKRTALKRGKPKKRKLLVDQWRQYGLTRPSKPRYVGLKGVYWYLLSQYTRQRDFKQFGTCISCGKRVDSLQDFDAGHYAPAGNCGFALLFLKINVNGECKGCNAFDSGHLIGYEKNLRIRYGNKIVDALIGTYLERHKTTTKEWTQIEYDTKIKKLQQELSKYN